VNASITPGRLAALFAAVQERHPLIHHITNVVTINDVANVTLAIGAAPVMAYAPEEAEEMVSMAGALALNIGTPTVRTVDVMIRAGRRANTLGIPVLLDPVGAGATDFRTEQALRLLSGLRIASLRGNAGEIATLAGRPGGVRGVDAAGGIGEVDRLAGSLARQTGAVVAATGRVDVVTDGERLIRIHNGDPLLTRITGAGCMATAAVAAFTAVDDDPLAAAAGGLVCFGIAAERAAHIAGGPGTFRAALLDAIAALNAETVEREARLET
jgi:hydroxyethylthiazole kinase